MPRPKVKIDLVELEKLCGMQCTDEEIAAFFDVSTRTIERRRQVKRYSEVMDRARSKGRVSVRRGLFREAARGNIAAIIFLAKNVIGCRDVMNTEHTGLEGGPIQIANKPDFSQLTDDELRQLREIFNKTKPPRRT
jgi:hypothetical protein